LVAPKRIPWLLYSKLGTKNDLLYFIFGKKKKNFLKNENVGFDIGG